MPMVAWRKINFLPHLLSYFFGSPGPALEGWEKGWEIKVLPGWPLRRAPPPNSWRAPPPHSQWTAMVRPGSLLETSHSEVPSPPEQWMATMFDSYVSISIEVTKVIVMDFQLLVKQTPAPTLHRTPVPPHCAPPTFKWPSPPNCPFGIISLYWVSIFISQSHISKVSKTSRNQSLSLREAGTHIDRTPGKKDNHRSLLFSLLPPQRACKSRIWILMISLLFNNRTKIK